VSRSLIERYFRAMQRGPDAEDELVALFAEDAVYIEPFGGGTHRGRAAIRAWLDGSWSDAPAGLRLTIDRIDAAGDEVVAHWTCDAPAFAEPAHGCDRFTIRDGLIARLHSTLLQPPRLR
jgi:ketosteroid isomerase-like protein